MSDRVICRPGGRSARIQASVHEAVRTLSAEIGRAGLTVPVVAARAGVPPSTIYRRWGDLANLLADVSARRLHPDQTPAEHGSLRADLQAWVEQYAEEMSSQPGRQMIRDVVSASAESGVAARCAGYSAQQIQLICDRAAARGETPPEVDRVLELVVAPILFRILFDGRPADRDYCARLLGRVI
jgi:AcrR family transcriptional regulator